MQAKTLRTRIFVRPTRALDRLSKRRRGHSISKELRSSKALAKDQTVYTSPLACFIAQDNGLKILRTRPCLRPIRKASARQQRILEGIVSRLFCASRRKMTMGTRLGHLLRQQHQRFKRRVGPYRLLQNQQSRLMIHSDLLSQPSTNQTYGIR